MSIYLVNAKAVDTETSISVKHCVNLFFVSFINQIAGAVSTEWHLYTLTQGCRQIPLISLSQLLRIFDFLWFVKILSGGFFVAKTRWRFGKHIVCGPVG